MNTAEVASVLTQMHSMRPQDALASTSGDARLLVERACLMTAYFASQSSSRLARNSGDWRFDEDSQRFVSRKSDLVVPQSSIRFDTDGRLGGFSYGEIPLEELMFELTSEAQDWRALGFSVWSNTTILWFAGNAQAFQRLDTLKGRRPVEHLGEGSCFVSGDQRHQVVGFVASLEGGAAVARVQSTPLRRDTLGERPLRLNLELPGSIEVTLNGTRVPRMAHAFEVDLRSRRVAPTTRKRTPPVAPQAPGTTARADASQPADDTTGQLLREFLVQSANADLLSDETEVDLRLSAASVVLAALSETEPDLLEGSQRISTLEGVAQLVASMNYEELEDLHRQKRGLGEE